MTFPHKERIKAWKNCNRFQEVRAGAGTYLNTLARRGLCGTLFCRQFFIVLVLQLRFAGMPENGANLNEAPEPALAGAKQAAEKGPNPS
jgi:hypothetical protein